MLDAAGTRDPDGNALTYHWFFYPEAGTGIPGHPVFAGGLVPVGGGGNQSEGGIPSAPQGPARARRARGRFENPASQKTDVMPMVAGTAHVILAVEDNGTPTLTSYRRVILHIAPAAK